MRTNDLLIWIPIFILGNWQFYDSSQWFTLRFFVSFSATNEAHGNSFFSHLQVAGLEAENLVLRSGVEESLINEAKSAGEAARNRVENVERKALEYKPDVSLDSLILSFYIRKE